MLTANRFTKTPTKFCRQRLEAALSNRHPIARGEKNHSAVMVIQAALADLNPDYLLPIEIDGYFGRRTFAAVESFQRDYGLVPDGMVGQQTLTQLNELYSGDVVRKPQGISIHIGLDRIDPGHYGNENALASCVNDARKMQEIADELGYETMIFTNEKATVLNFTQCMRAAIDNLFPGDSLMFTFSGHGSQVPNNNNDDETDGRDETLCFYDRMLIDDELYALLAQFRGGVKINLIFDSCHSGSAAKSMVQPPLDREVFKSKMLNQLRSQTPDQPVINNAQVMSQLPLSGKNIKDTIEGERPVYAALPRHDYRRDDNLAELLTLLEEEDSKGLSKSIDLFSGVYSRQKAFYDTIKNIIGPREQQRLNCAVISFSACQDSQTTPSGSIYSLFTANIVNVLKDGSFEGSCRNFHVQLTNRSPDSSTPALNTYGSNRTAAYIYERPFVI